jgi:hypothetical protein
MSIEFKRHHFLCDGDNLPVISCFPKELVKPQIFYSLNMRSYLILLSLVIVGTLACQTDSDCLNGGACIESVCQCTYLFKGDGCKDVANYGVWVAYSVFTCAGHFFIVVFAFYQLRRSLGDSKITKNMVTAELIALIAASTRKCTQGQLSSPH